MRMPFVEAAAPYAEYRKPAPGGRVTKEEQ